MSESYSQNFNHLKIHTQYSICEGAARIDDLQEYSKTAKNIFDILKKQINNNRIIIFATHNRFFANKSDCLLEMRDGSIKSTNV